SAVPSCTAAFFSHLLSFVARPPSSTLFPYTTLFRSLLTAEDHHVTADDLATRVQAEHPDIHRSTVYRTLDALEEMGVIDRISLGSRGAVYHLADHAHHHLVCGRCGAVEELPAELLAPVLDVLAERTAFTLDRPRVAITGLCPACRDADGG